MFVTTWFYVCVVVAATYAVKFLIDGRGAELRLAGVDLLPWAWRGLAVLAAVLLVVSAFYFLVESLRHPGIPWILAYPAAAVYLGICAAACAVFGVHVGLLPGEVRVRLPWGGRESR